MVYSRVGASCVGRPICVCAVLAPLRRVNISIRNITALGIPGCPPRRSLAPRLVTAALLAVCKMVSLQDGVLGSLEDNVTDFFGAMCIGGGAHGYVLDPSLQVRPSLRLQPGLAPVSL